MGGRLAAIDMGRKLGTVPFVGGGAGSPSYAMWPGPMPTSMSSFILIHSTVWPQNTNVTDRQTDIQTDRQTGQDIIGRTSLNITQMMSDERINNGECRQFIGLRNYTHIVYDWQVCV